MGQLPGVRLAIRGRHIKIFEAHVKGSPWRESQLLTLSGTLDHDLMDPTA